MTSLKLSSSRIMMIHTFPYSHPQPQEKEGQFSCVCAEGFTGEDCGTVTTSPRQQDRGPAMPAAFVAVIVAGVLVAGLLSALLVVAIVVWIRCRRRRQCKCKYISAMSVKPVHSGTSVKRHL